MQEGKFFIKIEYNENGTLNLIAANSKLPIETVLMQLRSFCHDMDKRYFGIAAENSFFTNDEK